MKKSLFQILVAVLIIGTHSSAATDVASPVVVNDVSLEAWEFDRELRQLIPYSSFHRRVEGERRLELESQARGTLIMKELKRQWAVEQELPVDATVVDQEMATIRDRFGDPEAFAAALTQQGITAEELRHAIMRDVTEEAADAHVQDAVPPPTEAEVDAFFAEHRDEYVTPESRHVIHLLIPVSPSAPAKAWEEANAEATTLAAAAKTGEINLAEEANRRGPELAPSLRDQTGDLGNVHQGSLKPAVDGPVFAAAPGDVVGPIRTLYGFSVLEVVSIHPPQQLELDQVRDAVADRFLRERRETALTTFETDLLASADIQKGQ